MNKFFGFFKHIKSLRILDLNMKKKILFFDGELDKFNLKEVNLKDFFKDGRTLILSPYPCKFYFYILRS